MANSYTNPKFHGMGDNPVVDVNVEHVIPLGSKISTIGINDGPIIDAFNIDWTTGDYSYDSYGHIIESTGQLIEELRGKASTTSLENLESTVNSLQTRSADYYEQRWRVAEKTATVNTPNNNEISLDTDHANWKLLPQYETGKNTWMTARKVIYDPDDNYTKKYDPNSTWSTPMKMTGDDGIAYPVHQVLLYRWTNSRNVPTIATDSSTKPSDWQESPGNSSGNNTYLWMIQGQRQESNYIKWDADGDPSTDTAYWSAPICLSGPDGEPGKDGTDIEFIYKKFKSEQTFTSNNNNPNYWGANQSVDYLGPSGYKWNDNPEGVSSSYPYEYCSIRYKTNGSWGKFIPPFLWSKFGENGLDGDGVEYIYTTTATSELPTKPYVSVSTFNDAQSESEWGVGKSNGNTSDNGDTTWHDDPQNVNNEYQKFQWVSTRKFKTITNDNYTSLIINGGPTITIENSTGYLISGGTYLKDKNNKNLKVGDKAWFPYSDPELWNWYVNDGTDAPRIVMVYQRNNSGTIAPGLPTKDNDNKTIITNALNDWCETPGNASVDHEYLWMTSAHYINKESAQGSKNSIIYTIEDSWQTAVCLTGEPGHEGEDGADIEFIYYRTADDNKTFDDKWWNDFEGDSSENDWPFNTDDSYEIDGIKYYDPDGVFNEPSSSDELHDVWTDNPLGVTSTYDYEYAAVRRKPAGSNSEWGDFCKPFLWSKYGEDGIDGDGIEYIFFKSADENEVVFSNNINTNNPNKWDMFDNDYQTDDFYGLKFKPSNTLSTNWWTDDPQGVDIDRRHEYVSKRKTITKNELFNIVRGAINPEGNPAISTYDNFIAAYENGPYDHGQFDSTAQYWNASTSIISSNLTIGELIETCYELFKQKKLKFWGKFSAPSLWSRYAVDGLVVNLTLESDNDMMAVAIDDDDIVTDSVSSVAKFELTHNTRVVDTSYYSMHIRESNMNGTTVGYGDDNGTTYSYLKAIVNSEECNLAKLQLVNSTYTLTTNIPEGFDMTAIDNELRISSYAYIYDNTFDTTGVVEIGTERPFTNKVQGLHLSIDDIYQIQTDKNVIKVNGSELEKVTVYLKSLTRNNRITTTEAAKAKHLYLYYDNYKVMPEGLNGPRVGKHTAPIGVPLTLSSVTSVVEHTFRLYYDPEDTFADSIGPSNTQYTGLNAITAQTPVGTPLDIETVQRVFDGEKGNPGVDSKSIEYIYFVTDNISYFTNSQHDFCNPSKWSTNDYITNNNVKYYAYNTDDFPFVENITSYHGWEDTQIGISEEHPYQFTSSRSFNTTTEKWEAFSEPVCTHNWGHSGEDGDGVEYIYYRNNSSSLYLHPVQWTNDTNFQNPEYRQNGSGWTDNPQGVEPSNKYEYVSIRKYRNINQNYFYNSIIDLNLKSELDNEYSNMPNDLDIEFDQDEEPSMLEYLYNICENYIIGDSPLSSDLFSNGYQSDYYNEQEYGSDLYQYFYELIPKYFNPVLYTATINHNSSTVEYFKLEQKSEKFWGPYSEPKLWAKYGENGQPGSAGPFKSTVFTRKSTTPDTPNGGTYSSPIPTDTSNGTLIWSDGIPAGTDPIWASSATFKSIDINGPTGGWSTPRLMADTDIYDVEFSPYSNGENTAPFAIPTTSNRHGCSSASNQKWFDPEDDATINSSVIQINGAPPTWSDMIWRAERERINYAGDSTDWSDWTITRIKGEKGNPGDNGNDAYTIDWTNDQINLAVDANGHVKKNQFKYSQIIVKKGSTNITSDRLKIAWDYTNDSTWNQIFSGSTYVTWSSGVITTNNGVITSPTGYLKILYGDQLKTINVSDLDSNLPVASQSSANNNLLSYICFITGGEGIFNNIIIPENGIEINLTIKIDIDGTNSWQTLCNKKLRICGQHIAQDGQNGENAITYEIVPTANSVSKSSTDLCTPSSLSYVVYKYNGTNISQETSFSAAFRAQWTNPDGGSLGYTSSLAQNGYKSLSYVNLNLWHGSGTSAKIIDRETIPIIGSGEQGVQGFTGPIVRMCGMFTDNSMSRKFGDGTFNTLSEGPQYDGTSPLYKDIVAYTWANGTTKYYTPNPNRSSKTYISVTNDTYLCKGSSYVTNIWPSNSGGNTNAGWIQANQFDFVATKLLYADQALINQISTHDLIATKQNGYPVAGITSGSKVMKDKEGNNILSPLNPSNSNNPISSTITNSGSSDNPTLNSGDTDGSNVRIFAGEIKKGNNYSLTYAPFNVRQDGTAYMTKAVVTGDITANTLSLGTGSFAYISSTDPQTVTLPALKDEGKTKSFYILSDYTSSSSNYRIRCKNSDETMNVSVGDDTPGHSSGDYWYIYPKKNRFYQCISVGKTWNIIINELTQATQGVEYQYIDVTKDVQLFGYKYENSNVKIIPYTSQIENDTDIAFGPYLTDNGTSIDIEFFTYLDTSHYGTSTSDYALADFGEFYWMTEGTN